MLRLVSLGSVYKAERGGEYGRTRDSYAHWASAQWCRGPGSAGLGSTGQCGAGERLPLGMTGGNAASKRSRNCNFLRLPALRELGPALRSSHRELSDDIQVYYTTTKGSHVTRLTRVLDAAYWSRRQCLGCLGHQMSGGESNAA